MAGDAAIRFAYYGKGKEIILLLHGYLESIEVWEELGGMLGKSFRVIAIDLPGHGMSTCGDKQIVTIDYMAESVAAVLEKANVNKCTIVGHSMGGYVAVALADLYPRLVERLVLFHSSPGAETPEKKQNRLREISLIEEGKKELLANINPGKGFAAQNLYQCAETIDELSLQVMMTDDEAIISVLKGMMKRPDRSNVFAAFPRPKLMIFGRDDNYIPIETAEAFIEKFPDAQHCWLEKSGHMGFIEEPDASLEILTQFIEGGIISE